MKSLVFFLLVFMAIDCHAVYKCTTVVPTLNLSLPASIQWQRESPTGWYQVPTFTTLVDCTGGGALEWVYTMKGVQSGTFNDDGKNYSKYMTSIDGIYYIVEYQDWSTSSWRPVTSGRVVGWSTVNGSPRYTLRADIRIKFVSGAKTLRGSSYQIPPFGLADIWARLPGGSGAAGLSGSTINVTGTTLAVKSKSCSLKSPGVVKLARSQVSQFESVGATVSETPFQFSVDCSDSYANYAVSYFMTDAYTPTNSGTTLTSASVTGTASGVAIQLVDGLKPVTFGPQLTASNKRLIGSIALSGGRLVKSLSARYQRTSTQMIPGSLSAGVTVTLVYD